MDHPGNEFLMVSWGCFSGAGSYRKQPASWVKQGHEATFRPVKCWTTSPVALTGREVDSQDLKYSTQELGLSTPIFWGLAIPPTLSTVFPTAPD